MRNLRIHTFSILLFLILFIVLSPTHLSACDNTPTQTAGNIEYAGDGLYTIDIQNCIGDAGSRDGFSIGVSDLNIVGYSPTTIENIVNGKTATGSFAGQSVNYEYIGAGYFVDPGDNSCFWTTITVDGFPAESQITLTGVNSPGNCTEFQGDTQTTPVILVPNCGEMFYDTGGPDEGYGNSENYSLVICGGGGPVVITFSEFLLAADGDVMTIYDNDGTSGSSESYTIGTSPGTVTSTNPSNCLTVAFESNAYGVLAPGWAAEITCLAPCPSDLNVETTGIEATCLNTGDGEVATTVSGGAIPYTFAWNTGATADKIQGVDAGMYIVTVTDQNGCTAMDTTMLTVASTIDMFVSGTLVECGTTNGSASVSVAGGGQPPYSYLWSTGSAATTITGLGTGEYIITVTDADGCAGTAAVTLMNDTDLSVDVAVLDWVTCFGYNDGEAAANASGGVGSYTYAWESNETTYIATQLGAGEQVVTVTDAENCMVTDSFTIQAPEIITAETGSAPASCFEGNDGVAWVIPEGGIDNFNYSWSNGATGNAVSELPAGTYIASVTDNDGCLATYEVEVAQPLSPVTLDFDTLDPSCGGYTDGTASVNAQGGTPGYEFVWSNGSTSAAVDDLNVGTHTVTVTDAAGCATIDSIMLSEPVPITFSVSTEDVICFGDDDGAVMIENVAGGSGQTYTYSMDGDNFGSSPSFIRLEAGAYEVYVQDDRGCVSTQPVTINSLSELIIDAGEDIELEYGDSVVLQPSIDLPNYEYQWTTYSPDGTLSCTDCPNPQVNTLYDITYTLQITDANGCTATDDIRIYINQFQRVYIPNAFTPNNDMNNDVFMIHGGKGAQSADIKVFDRWGELVYREPNAEFNNPEFGWDGTHNGTVCPAGVYVYLVDVTFNTGEILPYKGQLTLIR